MLKIDALWIDIAVRFRSNVDIKQGAVVEQ